MLRNDLAITLDGRRIALGDLTALDAKGLTPFQQTTVEFCRSWIRGDETFFANTSGSTGPPRSVTLRREQLVASAGLTRQALQLAEGTTALVCLDTSFIAGKMMLVRALVAQMNILATEPTANPFVAIPADAAIHFAALVPYQVRAIVAAGQLRELDRLSNLLIGGSEVDFLLAEQLRDCKANCYATFGMTETISHVALQKLNGSGKNDAFETLPGVTIGKDEKGCLWIAAPHLGPDRIVTRDLVDVIGPRSFRWLGRLDNMINTGGMKVIPEAIEKTIGPVLSAQGIRNRFFVHGMSHPAWGQQVTLVIEGSLDANQERGMLAVLASTVGKYEKPAQVLYSYRFTETVTGKINRRGTILTASPRPD